MMMVVLCIQTEGLSKHTHPQELVQLMSQRHQLQLNLNHYQPRSPHLPVKLLVLPTRPLPLRQQILVNPLNLLLPLANQRQLPLKSPPTLNQPPAVKIQPSRPVPNPTLTWMKAAVIRTQTRRGSPHHHPYQSHRLVHRVWYHQTLQVPLRIFQTLEGPTTRRLTTSPQVRASPRNSHQLLTTSWSRLS